MLPLHNLGHVLNNGSIAWGEEEEEEEKEEQGTVRTGADKVTLQ